MSWPQVIAQWLLDPALHLQGTGPHCLTETNVKPVYLPADNT